ncbi:MAG: hypothetical protein Q7Q71_14175, partial [Verrucomicrobiota bacterium JB023]|nr:hypothetical protein [Verrucomicrobiota bacterium JB023]
MRWLYSEPVVDELRAQVADARQRGHTEELRRLYARHAYRMHDLSECMKTLTQRFSSWFNRRHDRKGRLWEQRFKSVVVEDGVACKTMAAYIDLNPVRAGMVNDPAEYRWSSYGEAVAGGKKARAGLARAVGSSSGTAATELPVCEFDAKRLQRAWAQGGLAKRYRKILLGEGIEKRETKATAEGKVYEVRVARKGIKREVAEKELAELESRESDLAIAEVIRHRVRYFSDGVAIGGKGFVNEFFVGNRRRFGEKRKSGARKTRGALQALGDRIWSLRDLG